MQQAKGTSGGNPVTPGDMEDGRGSGMNRNRLTAEVKKHAKALGADLVGVAPMSRFEGAPKQMDPRYVVGVSFYGYGVSLAVGLGTAIPVLDEEIAFQTSVSDADITAPIIDYSRNYGLNEGAPLGNVSYADLKTGSIEIEGRQVPTTPLSSYVRAKEIAEKLKGQVAAGQFVLSEPVAPLPSADSGQGFKPLKYRPVGEEGCE